MQKDFWLNTLIQKMAQSTIDNTLSNFSDEMRLNLLCFETKLMNWGLPDVFILIGKMKSCLAWADFGIFERSGTTILAIVLKANKISPHLIYS